MAEFFGFEIKRKGGKVSDRVSFVPDTEADGAGVISTGGHFGAYLDLDGDKVKNEIDLILKYRDIAAHPETDAAIEDIINEAIVADYDESPCNIVLDKLDISDAIKEAIRLEFNAVLKFVLSNCPDIIPITIFSGGYPFFIILSYVSFEKEA